LFYYSIRLAGKMTLSRTELEGSLRRSDADIRPTIPANVLMIGDEKYSVVGLVSISNSSMIYIWCLTRLSVSREIIKLTIVFKKII